MLIPILGNIIAALNRIGQSSDAASATGTLHAKVSNAQNTLQKPRSGKSGSFSTTSTSYVTALSVSGKGRLDYLSGADSISNKTNIRVTIDGTVVSNPTGITNALVFLYPNNISSSATPFGMSFTTSLLIEVQQTGTGTSSIYFAYENE